MNLSSLAKKALQDFEAGETEEGGFAIPVTRPCVTCAQRVLENSYCDYCAKLVHSTDTACGEWLGNPDSDYSEFWCKTCIKTWAQAAQMIGETHP
jgi:hypothetical protein